MKSPRRFFGLGLGALVITAVAVVACGGKVTFVTGGDGTAGGGGSGPNECFIGHCGDSCIKCIGDVCNNGRCDANSVCQPLDVTFTCPPPPPG